MFYLSTHKTRNLISLARLHENHENLHDSSWEFGYSELSAKYGGAICPGELVTIDHDFNAFGIFIEYKDVYPIRNAFASVLWTHTPITLDEAIKNQIERKIKSVASTFIMNQVNQGNSRAVLQSTVSSMMKSIQQRSIINDFSVDVDEPHPITRTVRCNVKWRGPTPKIDMISLQIQLTF